ncbi:DUF4139 domain-containing protein [Flavobacteriaceae bacterium MHTCC 0001]
MKQFCILFLFWSIISFANSTTPVTSSVSAVTVYVDGAQVTRQSKISLPEGTTELSFTKLSPFIKENSIQVSGLNGASVLSINYAINHISKFDHTETVEGFLNEIEILNDAIIHEKNLIHGYEQEIALIENNRNLGNNNQVVSLEKLKQFAAYYRERITQLNKLKQQSLKKHRDYEKEINNIKKQLTELNVEDKMQTGEIKVKLNSRANKTLNLILTYNVTNAGWFPIYDIKADDINKPLRLNYKAHVYQTTGVSWDNVKLILSTNDPNTNNLKPEVDSKYLNFISRYSSYNSTNATKSYNYKFNPFIKHVNGVVTDETGAPLPGASIVVRGTTNGTVADMDGKFSLNPNGGQELEISYLGFVTTTIPIHSSIINISLKEDLSQLDEVVVIGYGTKKTSYGKDRGSKVMIQGGTSFKSNNNPLYIVDGVTVSESEYKKIHPDMIANIKVLKGAAKTKIYGTKGANGVVLITTKKQNLTANGDIITEGITNTNFEIKKSSTVVSDGDLTIIEIDHFELPAAFSYFAAPVVNENVFLTAKIKDWQKLNLLPGEANIYFKDSYSGVTHINPYATTDSLTISLGVDPNVVITRKPANNFKKVNFIGNSKILNKSYEIEIKNNKTIPIDVLIVDRIPVSQNKDIKVDDINLGDSEYDSKKGILTWKAKLKPGISETYNFEYSVKYPRYRKINL